MDWNLVGLLEILESGILLRHKNFVDILGYCTYRYFNYHEILFGIPNYLESLTLLYFMTDPSAQAQLVLLEATDLLLTTRIFQNHSWNLLSVNTISSSWIKEFIYTWAYTNTDTNKCRLIGFHSFSSLPLITITIILTR